MSDSDADALNLIEPFDPEKHDRTAFSCGIDQVDNFFRKTANKLSKADNLPRPGHGRIPAAYISMIGVDQGFQGKGFGGDLLIDCLRRLAQASEALGVAVVMLDVLDCGDPEQVGRRLTLYRGYGFEQLPANPLRLFLPMATVKALIAEAP